MDQSTLTYLSQSFGVLPILLLPGALTRFEHTQIQAAPYILPDGCSSRAE